MLQSDRTQINYKNEDLIKLQNDMIKQHQKYFIGNNMSMIIKSSLPFYELKKMIQINFRNLKSTKKHEKPMVEKKNTIEPFPINSK